jgi:hypothetical protein
MKGLKKSRKIVREFLGVEAINISTVDLAKQYADSTNSVVSDIDLTNKETAQGFILTVAARIGSPTVRLRKNAGAV